MAAASVNIHLASQKLRECALALELAAASEKPSEIVAGIKASAALLATMVRNLEQEHQVSLSKDIFNLFSAVLDERIALIEKASRDLEAAREAADRPSAPPMKGKK